MKYLHVLCEGKTELNFCAKVLSQYMWQTFGIMVMPQTLLTNRKKDIHGGMISFKKAIGDIKRILASMPQNETHVLTTMFDLYALPNDFPGYNKSINCNDLTWVQNIEEALGQIIEDIRFIPYIQLHEFEALVLCNINELKQEYPKASKNLENLSQSIKNDYSDNVENVNNGYNTAPSKRIIKALAGKYEYNKVKSGIMATSDYGIENLRLSCPHFNEWIDAIASKFAQEG